MKLRRDVCLATFGVCVAVTAIVARSDPGFSLAGEGAGTLTLELAAASLPVAAIALVWRPAFGALLVAALSTWLAAEWNSPGAGPLFTAGLVLYAAWPCVLAATALCGLDKRPLTSAERFVVGIGGLAGVGVLGVASALVFDPGAQGCADCPANLLSVADAPDALHTLGQVGLTLAVAWSICFGALAGIRLARSSRTRWQLDAAILVPATAAIVLFGADAWHSVGRGFLGNDPTDRALRLVQALALASITAAIALEHLRLRRTRARVAQLVLDIGAAPAPGELRAQLASSLRDPGLELLFPLEGGWIDVSGREAELPRAGRQAVTLVRAHDENVLAVVHERGLLDDPQLTSELARTARLAIEHERLHAVHRKRLEELRASRERIVATGERERRALERDLHDGAQQRLVTLGLAIRLARRHHEDPHLAEAEEHVRAAVGDLREVAHGLFPAVLADDGLGAAIDALSEQSLRLITGRLPDSRFSPAVESAAYFATCEALRLSEHEVSVEAITEEGRLRIAIGADGALARAMTHIQDRVGAAGGTVTIHDGKLVMEMPCGS